MSKCSSHPANTATTLCEDCEVKICMGCSKQHAGHTQILLKDIDKAYNKICSEHYFNINDIKKVQRAVKSRTDAVIDKVIEVGAKMNEELEIIRTMEVEAIQSIEVIKKGSDPIEEKYLKVKVMKKSKSRYAGSKRPEFLHSPYTLDIIPTVIGRIEWVAKDQELVELSSFETMTSKPGFVKSVRPVDSGKAWVLHYTDTAIQLVDNKGQVHDTLDLGEKIEDFCLTASGDVLYTPWNGRELKKHTKENKRVSLFDFGKGYTTRGLCVKDEEVMVCLCSSVQGKPNKLSIMSLSGNIARERVRFENSLREPGRVTCTPGGVIAIVDWNDEGRFLKVMDSRGKDLRTWTGEIKTESNISPFQPYDVSFCYINDEKRFLVTLKGTEWNKVCSLDVQGGNAKCIYTGEKDSCDGGISPDQEGNIWIGDQRGRIHLMKIKSERE